jgi:signal transduction histidine kinase
MHRLHVKIFLWFWLAVVVVTTTLGALTELTHTRAEDDKRWEGKYGPRVHLWARQETQILRRDGPKGLERYVGSFQSDPGVLNYIFDAEGHEVLGRVPPPQVTGIVTAMAESATGVQEVDSAERIIAERIVDTRGNSHVVVVDFPGPSVLSRSLFEFLSTDLYTTGIDTAALGRVTVVVAVAGVFCFLLAQHIARPIDRLRSAARRIADEQLQTRVDGSVIDRKDELADLGRDFDRMAERIEGLVTAQRHLLGDVSHALRSPLARLNVALGLARQRSGAPTEVHLDRIELEADRLNSLIGQLLKMARVDSGVDLEAPTESTSHTSSRRSARTRATRRDTAAARCGSRRAARTSYQARARCCAAPWRTWCGMRSAIPAIGARSRSRSTGARPRASGLPRSAYATMDRACRSHRSMACSFHSTERRTARRTTMEPASGLRLPGAPSRCITVMSARRMLPTAGSS